MSTNNELNKQVAALIAAMSPSDLAATHTAIQSELVTRQNFDLDEMQVGTQLTPERRAAWGTEILRRLQDVQG